MLNESISEDAVILLLLANYFVIVLFNRYMKYRQYRFYPQGLTFVRYLRKKFFSLNLLFYSIGLLFIELFCIRVIDTVV